MNYFYYQTVRPEIKRNFKIIWVHILFLIRTIHKIIKCLYIEQCKVENQWTAAQEGGIFPFPDLARSKCLCSPVGGG